MSTSFLVPRVMEMTLLQVAFSQTDDSVYVLQIDTVLCGECASSSSSSSSEDDCTSDMMQASESGDAPHEAVSNVVPLPSKVKADKGRYQGSPKLSPLLQHSAHLYAKPCNLPRSFCTCCFSPAKVIMILIQGAPMH